MTTTRALLYEDIFLTHIIFDQWETYLSQHAINLRQILFVLELVSKLPVCFLAAIAIRCVKRHEDTAVMFFLTLFHVRLFPFKVPAQSFLAVIPTRRKLVCET